MGSLISQRIRFIINASLAVFITYLCMYAFRKPFTSATYDGKMIFGVNYKILLILLQLIGYTISKYLGIKYIAELKAKNRLIALAALMIFAMVTLVMFGLTPYPYNAIFMLFNGLPLGLIWGVVFSFIEGRRTTELLGAIMASSFIVSSGFVKYSGTVIMKYFSSSEMWMPFVTALCFTPILVLGMILLNKIKPPDNNDLTSRAERIPMNKEERSKFFNQFGLGIFFSTIIYIGLTIFRDLRDNFAVEFWKDIGYSKIPSLLAISEIPIALSVMLIISLMILVKNNKIAFYSIFGISFLSGIILIVITLLYQQKQIDGVFWMITSGFAVYLPYIGYHTIFYERWIAFFKQKGNAGFLMYIADSAGYLGSILILLLKNFVNPDLDWNSFFMWVAFILGTTIIIITMLNINIFSTIQRKLNIN